MSVELKNWKELCKEKDERIKELEGKFDLIVERLEEEQKDCIDWITIESLYYDGKVAGLEDAIDIVKGVINERD